MDKSNKQTVRTQQLAEMLLHDLSYKYNIYSWSRSVGACVNEVEEEEEEKNRTYGFFKLNLLHLYISSKHQAKLFSGNLSKIFEMPINNLAACSV